MLVSNMDPAMTIPVRLRPPRKYPSLVFSFAFRSFQVEKAATKAVNAKKAVNCAMPQNKQLILIDFSRYQDQFLTLIGQPNMLKWCRDIHY